MRPRSKALSALGSGLVLLLSSCSEPATDPTPTPVSATSPAAPASQQEDTPEPSIVESSTAVNLAPRDVATDLSVPWSVVFLDGVPIISERDSGRILELADDGSTREMTVIEEVAARGEGGLLGLGVDDQNRLYAFHTTAEDNRIVRFDVSGEAGALAVGEPQVVLDGLGKGTNHNGGRIAFGPDGMLYATTGDNNVDERSQDLDSLSGKILRMTPDGGVPPDNPFDGSLVYSYGHRNPQGIAWADDGTMFSTEFGQQTWDELNIIEAGKNYGWPTVEGIAEDPDFVDPVQQWSPKVASPSGMAQHDGTLYIANLRGQVLRTVPVSDPSTSVEVWGQEYGRLRHVAVSPERQLWVVTNNTDSRGEPRQGDDRIIEISPEALVS